jgi:hypothetical protein
MRRVYGGAVLVIAGMATFIEASDHHPQPFPGLERGTGAAPLGRTAYDLLLIGAWALVILGALTIALGMLGYWRANPPA